MLEQSARQRTVTAGFAGLAHLALLALLLSTPPLTPPRANPDPLKVELVQLPPPRVEMPPPQVETKVALESGGSGASRPRPEQVEPTMLESAPPAADHAPAPIAVEPGTSPTLGTSAGTGATDGTGTGNGQGAGNGGGNGTRRGQRSTDFVRPDWIELPNFWLGRFYPHQAKQQHMSGTVILRCAITAQNQARNCRVHAERPAGYGFGAAALSASRKFKIRPPVIDGQTQPGTEVLIPLIFELRFKGQ